jgi:hypothetical protein
MPKEHIVADPLTFPTDFLGYRVLSPGSGRHETVPGGGPGTGGVLLTYTVWVSGLDRVLSAGLSGWRKPTVIHDPAKIICDLAVSLALGGDCLADVAVLRGEPGVYGSVASDATVSRSIDMLAAGCPARRQAQPRRLGHDPTDPSQPLGGTGETGRLVGRKPFCSLW